MPLHRLRREVDQVDAGVCKIERAAGQTQQAIRYLLTATASASAPIPEAMAFKLMDRSPAEWFAGRQSSHVFKPKRSGGRVGYVACRRSLRRKQTVMRGFTAQHAPMPSPAIMAPPDKRPSEAA